jgi:hypothetical protein
MRRRLSRQFCLFCYRWSRFKPSRISRRKAIRVARRCHHFDPRDVSAEQRRHPLPIKITGDGRAINEV